MQLVRRHQTKRSRGDTLVEVLLAIALMGAIISIAYALMTRGFNQAQVALDRTNTQAIMTGQASMLRAAHSLAVKKINTSYWNAIKSYVPTTPSAYVTTTTADGGYGKQNPDGCSSSFNTYTNKNFYFDVDRTDGFNKLSPLNVPYDVGSPSLLRQGTVPKAGDGLWIEGHTYQDSKKAKVYVFYIKACWVPPYSVPGTTNQDRTSVRLYDAS